MRASIMSVGTTSAAVRKNTAWFDMKWPDAPMAMAESPAPMEANRTLRPIRSPSAA